MGARSALLEPLLAAARGGPAAAMARDPAGRTVGSARALPSLRISALLVVLFAGFGALLGHVVSSTRATAASTGKPLKLVVPGTASSGASAAAKASGASTAPESSPSEETGSAQGEEAAVAEAPRAAQPARAPAPAPAQPASTGGLPEAGASTPPAHAAKLPPVKHVFLVMLSNEPYASVFGPASSAPYLAHTLEHRGELLVRYYAVAHEQLANEIALISGQGPTAETAANCPTYSAIASATVHAGLLSGGQGCVYPPGVHTLGDQLVAKHHSWRAYLQGIDEPGSPSGPCAHPALGSADPGASQPPATAAYATFRNPFAYFQGLTGSPACAREVVGLDKLAGDLANGRTAPAFAYIAPDRCHDGDPAPCAPGQPSGLAAADGWLRTVVPLILSSGAYRDGGLLVITVDQAPASGEFADSSSCCGQPRFPGPPPAAGAGAGLGGKGGGQVGALLLSPFVKAGTTQEPYNHFSLLRTIEDFFGLAHLGYAGAAGAGSLEPGMFAR